MVSTKKAKKVKKIKLLFVVTEDWYFISHRLSLAIEMMRNDYEVAVATRVNIDDDKILLAGVKLFTLKQLKRSNCNPFRQIFSIIELIKIYGHWRPDIIHHVAIEPVVYGNIAARFSGVQRRVNAIAGFGFVFSSKSLKAKFLKIVLVPLLMFALYGRRTITVVQNEDDLLAVRKLSSDHTKSRLVRGAGVDMNIFLPPKFEPKEPVVLLASRMLWSKGVGDFVEVARRFAASGVKCKFVLVGKTDESNLASVDTSQLERWHESGIVEWWGHKSDMPEVYQSATIVCLPSTYGEGVPKSLIEAAACSRPLIAYDVAGCRDIVRSEENGLLVDSGDVDCLANSIKYLLDNPGIRLEMCKKSRKIVLNEFSDVAVYKSFVGIYQDLMSL